MLNTYRAVLIDLSGVLYEGDRVLPGAVDAVMRLRQAGMTLRFVTNTASQSSSSILQQLQDMGFSVAPDELYTAPIAARQYVQSAGLRPFCLVPPAILDEFAAVDAEQANCVVLGDAGDGLTYAALNQVFRLCQQGAPLIGIGMNRYYRDARGLNLDAGPFIRAMEWAAGCCATIMGKPSADFFATVVASTPFAAHECLMVGDDVDSDVVGAVDAGLGGALIRMGKYQAGDDARLPPSARVFDSLSALVNALLPTV